MTFKAIYAQERAKDKGHPIPSRMFIENIAKMTRRSSTTVKCWLYGTQTPDALAMSILVKKFGISENELFPNKKMKDGNRRNVKKNREPATNQ